MRLKFIYYDWYYTNIQTTLMKFLPPGLEGLSTHTFGKLFVTLLDPKLNNNQTVTGYTPCFFGQCSDQNIDQSNTVRHQTGEFEMGSTAEYAVMTNIWMFYLYLSDMDHLKIQLVSPGCTGLFIQTKLRLKDLSEVMKKDFQSETILKQQQQRCNVLDQRGNSYGSVLVRVQVSFNCEMTRQVKDLINFQSMVIFEGISPINSQSELPRQPPQQSRVAANDFQQDQQLTNCKGDEMFMQSQIKADSNYDYQAYEEKDSTEDYRMIEDDIDKIIKDMQNKPYDCSRYQEDSHPEPKHNFNTFDNTNTKLRTSSQEMTHHETNRSHDLFGQQHSETNIKHFNMSRPPSSLSPKPRVHIPTQQTVISKSPRLLKQKQSPSSINLSRTQSLSTSNGRQQSSPSSYIELKIHEMLVSISNALPHTLFSELVQPCYNLKIYLNNDQDEYFAGQGIKEGEIISFNHNLKIRNVNTIQSIRLVVADDYGRVECEGVFDLSRLYASKDYKGVFTVPLVSPSNTGQVMPKLKVDQTKVIQISPLHRSLRISAELVERVELVQVFLKISKPSFPFTMIRYKIPMTKEIIEHMSVGTAHLNIFPHSCSAHVSERIMLEFWKNEMNIGQSEVSLRNIKNMNANVLSTNIEPVYLYDGRKQVRNILDGDKVVGEVELTLCFGTVKQMQMLLLAAIDKQSEATKRTAPKIPVSLDQRLGVLVTKKPVEQHEISIQVELDNCQRVHSEHIEPAKFHEQPSFGDHSIISHTSHNQFIDLEPSLVSFAKHGAQLEKPAATLPSLNVKNDPTVSEQISKMICELLAAMVPHLAKIKEQCRPHLVYNFIGVDQLAKILQGLGIKVRSIDQLFKLVLFPKSDMTNVNVLYDLLVSADIEGQIKTSFISDEMIIVGGLRLLYRQESLRQEKGFLLTSQMDFKQMAQVYKRAELKLTLHEFQILQKFINRYKTSAQAQQLKQAIINELESETMAELKEGFYEKDILEQIYNEDSSQASQSRYSDPSAELDDSKTQQKQQATKPKIMQQADLYELINTISSLKVPQKQTTSFKSEQNEQESLPFPTQPKSAKYCLFKHCLTISGVENVQESAECIFDSLPGPLEFKLLIVHPLQLEISFIGGLSKQFESQVDMKDADGKVVVYAGLKLVATAGFSLIKDINSVYALKAEGGQFCGLLHILLH